MTDELWADLPLELPGIALPMSISGIQKDLETTFRLNVANNASACAPKDGIGVKEVHIAVCSCDWELWRDGIMLLDSDSMNTESFAEHFKTLVGNSIWAVRRSNDNALVVFDIYPGYRLELMEAGDESGKNELFMIFDEKHNYKMSFVFPEGIVSGPR